MAHDLQKASTFQRIAALAVVVVMMAFYGPVARADDCLNVAMHWQVFERSVRDGLVSRAQLQRQIETWPQRLRACFAGQRFSDTPTFPLQGYGPWHAGKDTRGTRGFVPQGYAFRDGNRHGGHPAVDFFVHDRNQDSLDDRTGQPIKVLALAGGMVVSVCDDWQPEGQTAPLRGGNYVWIYHPPLDLFSYYAHLGAVGVSVGQSLASGEPIGILGRSGLNAHPKRSPTHLHLMVLKAAGMVPVSPLDLLQKVTAGKRERQ